MPLLRGVATTPEPTPPTLGVRETASCCILTALARSILPVSLMLVARHIENPLVSLSRHLGLQLCPLGEVPVRPGAGQSIEIALLDREEDTSELGFTLATDYYREYDSGLT